MKPSWLRAQRPIATLLLLFLAGCAAPAPDALAAPRQDLGILAEYTDDLGAIAGHVLDESLLPLPNATIELRPTEKESAAIADANSGADGSFAFSRLEPGHYVLRARHAERGNATQFVLVDAGQATRAQLMLFEAPSQEPYVVSIIGAGYLSCAPAIIIGPTHNRCPGESGTSTVAHTIEDGYHYILSETKWKSANSAEELAQYFFATPKGTNGNAAIDDIWGLSILKGAFAPGDNRSEAIGTNVQIRYSAVPLEGFNLTVTSYYAGLYANEVNQTANPACRPFYARCAGVGITMGLRYDQFLTVFMHSLPPDVDKYSAIPDQ